MGTSPQSLRHPFSAVPRVAEIISLGGWWEVSQVCRKEVQVEELSWEILVDWLHCFPAVLEALSVPLEMMALVLGTAAGEPFETRHNHLGGGHIFATVTHKLDIVGLCWWLVANCCLSCWMENGDKTAEHLEMAAVKEGNNTHAVDDIDWHVSQIDWLCQWQFMNHYLRILKCHHGSDATQLGHPVESDSLCSVEIPSSTCSCEKRWW